MRSLLLLTLFAGVLFAEERIPVLLELFTSEGCSNCPPADRLLVKLHQEQPIRGVEVIVLSEHVDYWNRDGWVDRFSSPEATERQNWYSTHWPTRVYTPQAVVDGKHEVPGGDGPAIVDFIRAAARKRRGRIGIAYALNEGGGGFRLDAAGLEHAGEARVMLAIVEDSLETNVESGQNSGRTLSHAGVLRALIGAGSIGPGESDWSGAVSAPFGEDWNPSNLRAVAFIQEAGSRAVLAIGSRRLTR